MNSALTISIAGAAGQGMQTIGFLLGKALIRGGLHVFATQDNESRIRGGHNFFSLRVSAQQVISMTQSVDVLIALNEESLTIHKDELSESSVIIYDHELIEGRPQKGYRCGVPLQRIARETGGDELYANAVALGAVMGILRGTSDVIETTVKDFFSKQELADANCSAARAGYDYVLRHHQGLSLPLPPSAHQTRKMFINGHEALALGALAAGCQFFAAYPMSPATSILTYLAGKADRHHMVLEQAEDEIAAINMAIGASCAAVRSMTATSGGGFSLMVESLGLSAIAEIPLVVVNSQRPGPATGLATRTEQGDLRFVLHASQGEFPRVILAPGTPRDAFYLTIKAFHLADKYQVPVIILTDQYLAESYFTEERFTLSHNNSDRFFSSPGDFSDTKPFLRYQFTTTGVSPRFPLSWDGREMLYDSHEHNENGHITEDALIRTRMVEKRFMKQEGLTNELSPPVTEGSTEASILLIGWGSTYGVLQEVTSSLNQEGIPARLMHLRELWPFPRKSVMEEIARAQKWLVIENNYTSQLSGLLQEQTCLAPTGRIVKYNGRPFYFEEVMDAVKKEVER